MPRWLVSFIILVGFLALVGLAFLPRSIHVEVNVDGSYRAPGEETTNQNAGEPDAAADGAAAPPP
jgi:hypothetical protein